MLVVWVPFPVLVVWVHFPTPAILHYFFQNQLTRFTTYLKLLHCCIKLLITLLMFLLKDILHFKINTSM